MPPRNPTPALVEARQNTLWFVESRSFAAGAWWKVTYQPEIYATLDGWEHHRLEMRCSCPHGRKQAAIGPLNHRTACAHMRAVVAFQNAAHARPVAPPNVAALVD